MSRKSKPWLNYLGDIPEPNRHEVSKLRKRKFGWALFWLLFSGTIGAHRIYLKDIKGALFIFLIATILLLILMLFMAINFELFEFGIDIALGLVWVFVVLLEYPKLKLNVKRANTLSNAI